VGDAHSRPVLGYAAGEQQSTDLVITALDMAATTRGTFPAGVVLHADRGTQFTSQKPAAYMRAAQGTVSMGRAGVCWDNAMAELFWATLTIEYYYRRAFTTRDQVYTGVATWIEKICEVMATVPNWAERLPLDADGFECSYYRKD
jgi:integrase catalytic subunit (fragment)